MNADIYMNNIGPSQFALNTWPLFNNRPVQKGAAPGLFLEINPFNAL